MIRDGARQGTGTTDPLILVRRTSQASEWAGESYEVSTVLPGDDRATEVTIYGPELAYGGDLRPARVNWPSIGAVSVEAAAAFGRLLSTAAALAPEADGPTKVKTDSPTD